MEQYISKSALVAEIERLKECNRKICGGNFDFLKKSYPEHYYSTEIYDDILSFLDALEVKEIGVDLGDPSGDIGAKTVWDSSNLLEISRHGNSHIEAMTEALRTEYEKGRADVLRCIDPDEMVADFCSQPLSMTRSLASIYRQGIIDILKRINNNEKTSITSIRSIDDCGL